MNRRDRRAAQKSSRLSLDSQAVAYVRSYRCPDCDSVSGAVTRDEYGVHHATILHDPSCPRLRGVTP